MEKEKAHVTSSNIEMSFHYAVGLCAFQARQEEQEVPKEMSEENQELETVSPYLGIE